MNQLSIFKYESARQYLLDALDLRQKQDPKFSLRKWSKEMGMNSHTLLLLLLQGKRPLRVKHAQILSKGLTLSPQEKLYLQALIQFESSETIEEKELCQVWLSDLKPNGAFRSRELDEFSVLADWIHCALLAMTETKMKFKSPEEVSEVLREKVPVHEVRDAIQRLIDLDLLKRDEKGVYSATVERLSTPEDVRNLGAREYHRQVIELARKAIEDQETEEREYQSTAFSIDTKKLGLAKTMIRKFRSDLIRAVGSTEGDAVYQLNMQLFSLTQKKKSDLN